MTDLPDFTTAMESLLSRAKPMTSEAYRQHIFNTSICDTMRSWGFRERFRIKQEMPRLQQQTFDTMKSKLKRNGSIVALVGERGLGKTTIAAQFALAHAWKNYEEAVKETGPRRFTTVLYRKCAALVARFKPMYSDYGSVDGEMLENGIKYLSSEDFLVIDEVHDCDDQKMKTRVLTDLIDRRYADCLDTVLIANQTPEDFATTIGDSILSRLGEHGAILPCEWNSFRTP
jgi:DNA replication protein DnaC